MAKIVLNFFFFFFLPFSLMAQSNPSTFVINGDNLIKNKREYESGNNRIIKAVEFLLNDAGKSMRKAPYSITDDTVIPSGGTIHDYYSLSRYWWPNPKKKSGLPYIPRDGKVNPEIHTIPDHDLLAEIGSDARTLGLAYYFTGEEQYARKAKELITHFFINPETKMNPNLDFSSIIKGKEKTSGGRIIDGNSLLKIVDGIQLIKASEYWTATNQVEMKQWFRSFLDWMRNSNKGKSQAKAVNNVGTYYTLQAATYLLFLGEKDSARELVMNRYSKLIDHQLGKSGQMLLELKRATPYNYVKYNLRALLMLKNVASYADIDLWSYKNKFGISMEDAFKWLLPYARGKISMKTIAAKNVSASSIKRFLYFTPVNVKAFLERLFSGPEPLPKVTKYNYLLVLMN